MAMVRAKKSKKSVDSKREVEEEGSDRVEVRRVVVEEAVEVSSAHVPGGEAI